MIVCICRRVSDREIQAWAEMSDGGFEDLQTDLGVSTCCGDCRDCARACLDAARAPQTVANAFERPLLQMQSFGGVRPCQVVRPFPGRATDIDPGDFHATTHFSRTG